MRIRGDSHLTYCTNVHAGESLAEVERNLRVYVAAVKQLICPDAPFGVGLWLSARAADELREPDALGRLRALLADLGLYVFTLNGFPYGAFHGRVVKTAVYSPDWRDPRRLAYSNALADLLAALLPDGVDGSISTMPCAFKPDVREGDHAVIAEQLLQHAAHLHALRGRTGKTIALAIEPEPACLLETTDETVAFFARYLHDAAAARRLGELTGEPAAEAAAIARRHLGVCLDACHAAVEHELAAEVVSKLQSAGIAIVKIQLSAGIRIARATAESVRALEPYADPVYLHQVVARRGETLERYVDLPDALAALTRAVQPSEALQPTEWRVHYHVPVFLAQLRALESTQPFLRELLALQRTQRLSAHLEVETYTWDVLPAESNALPAASTTSATAATVTHAAALAANLARELRFCLDELSAS
jgi:sugar phosphate isomerase/epimerase